MEIKQPSISTVNVHTMTSQQILSADFLDILFDNRNKAYGAYMLRKQYPNEMIKALMISLTAVFLLIFGVTSLSSSTASIQLDDGVIVTTTALPPTNQPKPEAPKPPQQKAVQQVKQQIYITPKIVATPVTTQVATQDALLHAQVSNITLDGPAMPPVFDPGPPASGAGSGIPAKEPEPKKEVAPDRQPQYPGGMQAWSVFLNSNLRAPQDLDPGEKKIVHIRFHVDVDGTITNFQVMQSGGSAFDNEVIRVLKKMPKWVPAMQAGKPVAISFTQPVTFVGLEE